jgi:beta-lactamase class C
VLYGEARITFIQLNVRFGGRIAAAAALAAALCSLSLRAAEVGMDPRLREFEEYFQANVVPRVPGAALAVVAEGQVQLLKSYGIRKADASEPVTKDTVFRLASVSKSFAAAAAGILVRKQLLEWDTKINSRLDINFKNPDYGRQITLRNVLSHSTGLVQHAYTDLVEENVPYSDIIVRLKDVDFICPPGKCYTYQNVVFSLTGDVIESVTGKSYEDFVRENLFRPLGMGTASIGWRSFYATADRATPHVKRNQRWLPVNVKPNYYSVAPAAGVNASINDMKQWLLAQLGKRPDVLPTPTLNEMQSPAVRTTPYQAHYKNRKELGEVGYGLGWRVFDYGATKNFVHHGGYVQGMVSEIIFNRDLQMGMVFLTNSDVSFAGDLVFKFLEIYQGSGATPPSNAGTPVPSRHVSIAHNTN